jgi:type IX secretion system PorP/SprF family membrane protein
MKKYLISLIVLFTAAFAASAQRLPESNFYVLNPFVINPAFAGLNGSFYSMLGFRNQLTGLNGGPRNLSLSLHTPVSGKASLGGNIFTERRGLLNVFSAGIASSYLVKLSSEHLLRFGLSGGLYSHNIQTSGLKNADVTDKTLFSENVNFTDYNFGAGVAYNFKGLKAGLAFPNLAGQQKKERSFFTGFAAYDIIAGTNVKVTPAVLYNAMPVIKNHADVSVMATWKNRVWLQGGYRSTNSVLAAAGLILENIQVAYHYGLPVGIFADLSSGTHEIGLVFTLPSRRKGGKFTSDTSGFNGQSVSVDTARYEEKFDELSRKLSAQQKVLDSLLKSADKNNADALKEKHDAEKRIAELDKLQHDLANYLKEVHHFADKQNIDLSTVDTFNLKKFDYHVVIGVYKDLNFVKFLQKHLKTDYNIPAEIIVNPENKFYILSTKKVYNKEDGLSEIQKINSRVNDKYLDGDARIMKLPKQ